MTARVTASRLRLVIGKAVNRPLIACEPWFQRRLLSLRIPTKLHSRSDVVEAGHHAVLVSALA
jgi:hypothetical protein